MGSIKSRVSILTLFLIGCIVGCSFVIGFGLKHRPERRHHTGASAKPEGPAVQSGSQKAAATSSDPLTSSPQTKTLSIVELSSAQQATDGNSRQYMENAPKKSLICYYGAYAAYRDGDGHFTTDKINPHLCTHVIHGSFGFTENNTIQSAHPNIDFDEEEGSFGLLKQLGELKQINPSLKTLISIGGSEVTSGEFSTMASQADSRQQFIASVLEFLAKHQLDGVDINWQFPGAFTGEPGIDKANFVLLLNELASALEPQNYVLSAQVAAAYPLLKMGYDIDKVSEPLDLILLMAYDYNETRDNKTTLIAPLYAPKYDRLDKDNVDWSVNYWLKGGAPPEKLILGVTSYAFTFTLNSAATSGIGAPADEPGEEGEFTKMQGLMGYNEVCDAFRRERRRWRVRQDNDYQAVYAVNGLQWVSYEDRRSLALKTRYAVSKGLGGVALYSLDTDDFLGRCHNVPFPLLRRIKRVLAQASQNPRVNNPPSLTGEQLAEREYIHLGDSE